MEFIKKVTQRLLHARNASRFAREDGLINTTDLLVATAATVVLAAGVGGTVLGVLDESKYGKAQPDAQAISQALTTFYKDTGKWPGQAEDATLAGEFTLLATGVYTTAGETTTSTFNLPSVANGGLEWPGLGAAKCGPNSGQGFVNATVGIGEFGGDTTGVLATTNVLNLNSYLVREPTDTTAYPNWAGPYIQEIATDPWDRSWVVYLAPLYCSEAVTSASGAGTLGYAWLLSGGTNRTITTPATFGNLDPQGDDTGVNLGKLTIE